MGKEILPETYQAAIETLADTGRAEQACEVAQRVADTIGKLRGLLDTLLPDRPGSAAALLQLLEPYHQISGDHDEAERSAEARRLLQGIPDDELAAVQQCATELLQILPQRAFRTVLDTERYQQLIQTMASKGLLEENAFKKQ